MIIFTFLFLAVSTIYSQIVIERNEYNATFGAKNHIYSLDDTTGNGFTVNVGTNGGPQNWTFTTEQFPGGDQRTYTIVDPATTPAAADFSGAHHAWFFEEDTVSYYNYFQLSTTELSALGSAIVNGDSTILIKKDPPEIILPFPAAYQTNWSYTSVSRFDLGSGFELVDSTVKSFLIDAWGTVTVPAGTYDCLRIFEREREFQTTVMLGTVLYADTSSDLRYNWVAENVGFLADVTSLPQETDPNFTKAQDVSMRTGAGVEIAKNKTEPITSFELEQNFPNPFNPLTTIAYHLPQTCNVELAVFDQLGQKVTTLYIGKQTGGVYRQQWDASGLASGIYYCRLKTSSGFVQMRKLILLQ